MAASSLASDVVLALQVKCASTVGQSNSLSDTAAGRCCAPLGFVLPFISLPSPRAPALGVTRGLPQSVSAVTGRRQGHSKQVASLLQGPIERQTTVHTVNCAEHNNTSAFQNKGFYKNRDTKLSFFSCGFLKRIALIFLSLIERLPPQQAAMFGLRKPLDSWNIPLAAHC